jgi:hypothetical protein
MLSSAATSITVMLIVFSLFEGAFVLIKPIDKVFCLRFMIQIR